MERQVESNEARPPEDAVVTATAGGFGSPPDAVTLTFPAQPRYLRVARLVASGLANELGFGVDRLDDVRLAVGEACSLAVQFGATTISLAYVLDDHRLDVSIQAALDGPSDDVDVENVALVGQVLAVAGSDHRIDRQDGQLSVRVSFTDGS